MQLRGWEYYWSNISESLQCSQLPFTQFIFLVSELVIFPFIKTIYFFLEENDFIKQKIW